MGKADEISDKLNDVRTVKNKTSERKQQTTSETSNIESSSSSYNTFSENYGSKVNKKASHIKKNNDGPNTSADADNDYRLRNIEDKSSLSSDEYENNKVSVGNHKELVTRHKKKEAGSNSDGGNLHEEEVETSSQSHHTDDSDESDVVEHDVKVCDICGDAGREDLLAVCCRCIDGAEHTYCMKMMVDQVPQGDWLCEECKVEEVKNSNRQTICPESLSGKDQASDVAVRKVSGKRHAEDLASSLSFKKQALEITTGSTKDVDRGKVKSIHQFSSDSHYGNESKEGSRSPATRPRSQSLRGAFSKSNSFNFPSARSKTKLVDDITLQRQKSTKERSSHDTIAVKEMSKSMSFRSTNFGSFGSSGYKVKMLSPKLSHVQDVKSPNNKKERSFERINSVKSSSSSSAASTPKADRLSSSRGETNSVSPGSNSEVKPLKSDSKIISGLKSTNRSANTSAEAPVSLGQINEQLPSSPTKVATTSSAGVINAVEQKSIDNSSKVAICKESTSHADGTDVDTTGLNAGSSGLSCQNNKQTGNSSQGSLGNNVAAMKSSKDVKKGDNKLKDAIEAALLKKPGICRKTKVSDQPDELSVPTMNSEAAVVDRVPHSRNAGSLTSADVSLTDLHGKISRSSNFNHSKHSNGNSYNQSLVPPVEGNHLTAGLSSHDDVALPSLSMSTPIPDNECIWQGSFEINRRGKTTEFWDGLQAHLSTCASPRVFEAVNKFPHKILLNGVSRASAWPTQFENDGVKEDHIAIYFFAKDIESYDRSYQFILDDMIRGDLALIGSVNGTELLIFPSNQLPERSNRWNMLFFLWGVFRGKKKKPLHQIPNISEKTCVPQSVSSISIDKTALAENAGLVESVEKDKHVDSESKVNLNLQDSSHEKAIDSISGPVDIVNVVPVSIKEIIPESSMKNEPIIIDLSEDDDVNGTSESNTKRDARSQIGEQEGNLSKKQKNDLYGGGNSNGEMHFFPVGKEKTQQKPVFALDLNEDISCLAGETDNIVMTKKEVDGDVASLSLSLAFSPLDKDDEDYRGRGKWQSGPSVHFRDKVDKQ